MYEYKDESISSNKGKTFERWKQNYNEHLNGTEVTCMEFQGSGGNDYLGMLNNSNQPAPTFREAKDAIQQLKNNKIVRIVHERNSSRWSISADSQNLRDIAAAGDLEPRNYMPYLK